MEQGWMMRLSFEVHMLRRIETIQKIGLGPVRGALCGGVVNMIVTPSFEKMTEKQRHHSPLLFLYKLCPS
jgi:hypothetical protein